MVAVSLQLDSYTIARFWSKVDKSNGPEGCWLWTDAPSDSGYGVIKIRGRIIPATHISLILGGKPRPSQHHGACHTCDVPMCVQPIHLWWGTNADNAEDKAIKGRSTRGETHPRAKLNEKQVQAIIELLKAGHTQRDIAKRFDVHYSSIAGIKLGYRWAYLTKNVEW